MAYRPVHVSLNRMPVRQPFRTLVDRKRDKFEARPIPAQSNMRVVKNGKQHDLRGMLRNKYCDLPMLDANHESNVVLADGRSAITNSKALMWDRRFSAYHSPLIALVYRAIYTKHCLGSTLEYDDLPESVQPFYYPTCI
jgi:hypothetical protein